jgi:hypothetical protein
MKPLNLYLNGIATGAALVTILTLALHTPEPRPSKHEVIDAIAWVMDGNYYPPEYDNRRIPRPPELPAWKRMVHFGDDNEAMTGLVIGANGF